MKKKIPSIVVSDEKGRINSLPYLEAAGMKGGSFFRLSSRDLIELPFGSELFMLPQRSPVGYNPKSKKFIILDKFLAIAAFISPGYTISYNSPYIEKERPEMLPLFSYGAVAFYKGKFYTAAVRVDREKRQDLRLMDMDSVKKNVKRLRRLFPGNRLIRHLENCALLYGCPAAKNFFLSRYEAPLPTSPYCNARCIGCISYQLDKKCSITQPRIEFIPTPEEVSETALYHMDNLRDPVVSFGQGCEGEPLLVGNILERSIKLIRKNTKKGIINLNTNASHPKTIARLFDAGLDSIRVSLNSAREEYYTRYYKPKGYSFGDVIRSIKIVKRMGGFVSINYLVMPGFTDSQGEYNAFRRLVKRNNIDMVQWRNLNFDPIRYFRDLKISVKRSKIFGMKDIIYSLKKELPGLMMGYFNPSRARIGRIKK